MQRRIEQVDALTGEVLEGAALVLTYPKRQNGFQQKGWIAMSQGAFERLVNADITKTGFRVLVFLLSRLDFENHISVSQADIARQLGIDRSNVHKAMAELVAEGVMLEGPRIGMHRTYRLSAAYGWKGSFANHHKALSNELKGRMDKARMSVAKA